MSRLRRNVEHRCVALLYEKPLGILYCVLNKPRQFFFAPFANNK